MTMRGDVREIQPSVHQAVRVGFPVKEEGRVWAGMSLTSKHLILCRYAEELLHAELHRLFVVDQALGSALSAGWNRTSPLG